MPAPLLREQEELLDHQPTPHLSYSRINRYLTCPEQYRLYYVERLRPKVDGAGLVFGALIHASLADYFRSGTDPVEAFRRAWENLKIVELRYNSRESWDDLYVKGGNLLKKFLAEEAPRIEKLFGIERDFKLMVASLDLPFVGIVDLVAQVDGEFTVVDFKTAASDYEDHEVELSDQLTAYWAAVPEAKQVALCVLIKTKEPRIEWHFAERNAHHLVEYLDKVQLVAEDIAAVKFYKRPGKHCGYCDFLPVCLGDKKKAQETLVRIA